MKTRQKIADLIKNKEDCDYKTLEPMFDQLQPASIEFMIGQWHGGTFNSKWATGNFYGKRFNSPEDCEPMLMTKEDGTIYAWPDWGAARLREVSYGGKVQATIIYDDRPLMDYFRKVTDDIVVGLGDLKGKPKGFFWLERDK